VIRLTVFGERGQTALVTESGYFRISGGVIWVQPGEPLVRYVDSGWKYRGTPWSGMRLEGKCRIVFGLPREPAGASDRLESLTVSGTTLSAGGIPFAVYEPLRDMWRGAVVGVWWHAFRIESVGLEHTVAKRARRRAFRGEVIWPKRFGSTSDEGSGGNTLN
jgi:hypothetical protein